MSIVALVEVLLDTGQRRYSAAMTVRSCMLIDLRLGRLRLLKSAKHQPAWRPTGPVDAVSHDPWSRAVVWSVNAALEREEPTIAAELAEQSRPAAA